MLLPNTNYYVKKFGFGLLRTGALSFGRVPTSIDRVPISFASDWISCSPSVPLCYLPLKTLIQLLLQNFGKPGWACMVLLLQKWTTTTKGVGSSSYTESNMASFWQYCFPHLKGFEVHLCTARSSAFLHLMKYILYYFI